MRLRSTVTAGMPDRVRWGSTVAPRGSIVGIRGLFEGWHLVVLLLVIVVLFGAKRLPDASRAVGRSLKIFKSEIKELNAGDDDDKPRAQAGSAQSGSVHSEDHPAPVQTVRTETVETHPVSSSTATAPADRSPVDRPRV